MNRVPKSTDGKFVPCVLLAMSMCVATTFARVMIADLGWIEHTPRLEVDVNFATPLCVILGVYVFWHSMQRLQAVKKARNQALSELREKLDRRREGTPSA